MNTHRQSPIPPSAGVRARHAKAVDLPTIGLSTFAVAALLAALLFAAAPAKASETNQTVPARDVATFSDDLRLTNSCIEAGRSKQECLCVTRILKYELSLQEYRMAASSYTHQASYSAKNKAVRPVGHGPSATLNDTNAATATKAVVSAPDFSARCEMAGRYFRNRPS